MVGYGTGAFSARDFVRTGIVITVLGYLLTLAFGATYWRWLGYVSAMNLRFLSGSPQVRRRNFKFKAAPEINNLLELL